MVYAALLGLGRLSLTSAAFAGCAGFALAGLPIFACVVYLLLVALDHQVAQVGGGTDADAAGRLLLEEAGVSGC